MRRWIALLVLLLVGAWAYAQAPEASENLEARPEIRLARTEIDRVLTDSQVERMARSVPEDARADFHEMMRLPRVREFLVRVRAAVLAKHYTVEEIEALLEFYTSDIGRSIAAKQGQVEADSRAIMSRQLSAALGAYVKHKRGGTTP